MSEVKIGDVVWLRQKNHSKVKMGIVRTLTREGYALVIVPGRLTNSRHACPITDLKLAKPGEIKQLWPDATKSHMYHL